MVINKPFTKTRIKNAILMLMRSNGHKSPIIAAHYYENTTIETEISVVYTDQRRQITKCLERKIVEERRTIERD